MGGRRRECLILYQSPLWAGARELEGVRCWGTLSSAYCRTRGVGRISGMTLWGSSPVAAVPLAQKRPGIRTLTMAAVAGLSTFDPSLTLAIGTWAALVVFICGRPLKLEVKAPVLLAVVFVLWAYASQTWTAFPDISKATAFLWGQLLVMFISVYDLIKTKAQLRLVAYGYLVGAIFTVAKSVFADPYAAELAASAGGRAELGNANVNYVAYALSTGFALVVLLWMTRSRTKSTSLVLGATLALIVVGITISDTRGALLGLFLVAAWLLVCVAFRHPPLMGAVAILMIAALSIVTGIADRASLAWESGVRATGDWSGRLIIWPWAREVWATNPWFGVGAGGFREINAYGVAAHNIILQTGTGLGIVGVTLLLALIWAALAWNPTSGKQPKRALLVGAFLLASAPAYLSGVWETAPASWVVLAIFARLNVLKQDVRRRGQNDISGDLAAYGDHGVRKEHVPPSFGVGVEPGTRRKRESLGGISRPSSGILREPTVPKSFKTGTG